MKETADVDPRPLADDAKIRRDTSAMPGADESESGHSWTPTPLFGQPRHRPARPPSGPTEPPAHANSLLRRRPLSLHSLMPAVHRIILAVDIEDSTKQCNSTKAQLRDAMYKVVEDALRRAGITEQDHDPMVDRGDSLLALIHPVDEVPKSLLLDTVVPTLNELLGNHNSDHPDYSFRLRVVVHAGEVHWDGRGWFGESLDIAFRLLDAADVKNALREAIAPTVLVVSDEIHRSVVRQGYDGIDYRRFVPIARLRVGHYDHHGWLQS